MYFQGRKDKGVDKPVWRDRAHHTPGSKPKPAAFSGDVTIEFQIDLTKERSQSVNGPDPVFKQLPEMDRAQEQ